jgi:hypothetical protein
MNEALEQVDSITNNFAELQDIMKRPTSRGIADLIDWVERNGKNFAYSLDDLRNTIEHHMEQQVVYGQLQLNADLDKSVEMRVSA